MSQTTAFSLALQQWCAARDRTEEAKRICAANNIPIDFSTLGSDLVSPADLDSLKTVVSNLTAAEYGTAAPAAAPAQAAALATPIAKKRNGKHKKKNVWALFLREDLKIMSAAVGTTEVNASKEKMRAALVKKGCLNLAMQSLSKARLAEICAKIKVPSYSNKENVIERILALYSDGEETEEEDQDDEPTFDVAAREAEDDDDDDVVELL